MAIRPNQKIDEMIIHQPMPDITYPHTNVMVPPSFVSQDHNPCSSCKNTSQGSRGASRSVRCASKPRHDNARRCGKPDSIFMGDWDTNVLFGDGER